MRNNFLILIVLFLISVTSGVSQDVLEIGSIKQDSVINRIDGFYEAIDYKESYDNSKVKFALKPAILIDKIREVKSEISNGICIINIEFNEVGASLFSNLTLRNIGKPIAIFIDNKIISSPIVRSSITGGKVQIQGRFSESEMQRIVKILSD